MAATTPAPCLGERALVDLATMSRCCGTRGSAAHAALPASGPRLHTLIWIRMSLGRVFGVLDEHVEIAVIVEHAGVHQFVFWIGATALLVYVSTRSS